MKIYVGTDHNGFRYKPKLVEYLKSAGHQVIDEGEKTLNPTDDFPVFASKVAQAVLSSDSPDTRGILVCGSGQGMVMAANRFNGIRAGLGWSVEAAKGVRNDEDSNVLSLPSAVFENNTWQAVVDAWLHTPFANATRYIRRNNELDELIR